MNNRSEQQHTYNPDNHPSYYELALISEAVYRDAEVPGWKILCKNWIDIFGYEMVTKYPPIVWSYFKGQVYVKRGNEGKIDIVFAFGGTNPESMYDLLNDLYIFRGSIPPRYDFSVFWAKKMLEIIYSGFGKDVFDQATATITGHSLGAFLAQMVFVCNNGLGENFSNREITSYVGFECPGIYQSLLNKYKSDVENIDAIYGLYKPFCKTINGRPNAINSFLAPFGNVLYAQNDYILDYQGRRPFYPIPRTPEENIEYYIRLYSLCDVHLIRGIRLWLLNNNPIDAPRRWGADGGYYEYCNYDGCPGQKDYWDSYIEFLWEIVPSSKYEYKEFEDLKKAILNQLAAARAKCDPLNPGPHLTSQAKTITFFKEKDLASEFVIISRDDTQDEVKLKSTCIVS